MHCAGLTGFTGTWWRYWAVAAAVKLRRRRRKRPPPWRRPLNSLQVKSMDRHLEYFRFVCMSCRCENVSVCFLSESDVFLQAPWRFVLPAIPLRGSTDRTPGSEPGWVVGGPLLHQETWTPAAAGGQQHPAAESGWSGEEHKTKDACQNLATWRSHSYWCLLASLCCMAAIFTTTQAFNINSLSFWNST